MTSYSKNGKPLGRPKGHPKSGGRQPAKMPKDISPDERRQWLADKSHYFEFLACAAPPGLLSSRNLAGLARAHKRSPVRNGEVNR